MHRIFRLLVLSLLCTLSTISSAASLCNGNERVAFSCRAGQKTVSLCVAGNLQQSTGRLIYRFGRDADHVELEHGASSSPAKASFTFNYSSWAKGESVTVGFKRGDFKYSINHAAGVYGVDGGPNVASVLVLRGEKKVAEISCHEPSATDNMYEELGKLGLPPDAAL